MMAVGTADLHSALKTAWIAHGVDHEFNKFWAEANRSGFPTLHESEAGPSQPFPYCVFDPGPVVVMARMSSTDKLLNRELRDAPFDFTVYAKKVGSRSAKDVAQELVEIILQKFGGHPSVLPMELVMSNGAVYHIQYQGDQPNREGDDEYSWRISYMVKFDVPVKVA